MMRRLLDAPIVNSAETVDDVADDLRRLSGGSNRSAREGTVRPSAERLSERSNGTTSTPIVEADTHRDAFDSDARRSLAESSLLDGSKVIEVEPDERFVSPGLERIIEAGRKLEGLHIEPTSYKVPMNREPIADAFTVPTEGRAIILPTEGMRITYRARPRIEAVRRWLRGLKR